MNDFNIKVSSVEGRVPVTVLHLSGDIDAKTHQELDAKTAEVIDSGALNILLDLTNTNYMSSAGFRSIHKIHTALNNSSDPNSLKLLNASDEVKRLMKAMGFDVHISVHDDLKDAVDAF